MIRYKIKKQHPEYNIILKEWNDVLLNIKNKQKNSIDSNDIQFLFEQLESEEIFTYDESSSFPQLLWHLLDVLSQIFLLTRLLVFRLCQTPVGLAYAKRMNYNQIGISANAQNII